MKEMIDSEDRELLELAAKAADVQIATWSNCQAGGFQTQESAQGKFWNPLQNDGDALRLAVKLDIFSGSQMYHYRSFARFSNPEADALSITRWSIVRTAAEIGKAII